MSRGFLTLASACCLTFAVAGEAAAAVPKLAALEARNFQENEPRLAQKSFQVNAKAESITVSYSSDVPITISVSYPERGFKEDMLTLNPLDVISVQGLPKGDDGKVTIDLTASPAWSPRRKAYIVYVSGMAGGSVAIKGISARSPAFMQSLEAAFKQLFTEEPQLPSSINFLLGYRIWGESFSVLLGLALLAASALAIAVKNRDGKLHSVILLIFAFVLVYDLRYSMDLVRANARDISEWSSVGEYRQLGPLPLMSDFLREESENYDGKMNVAMCFDLEDIVQKYLRYNLYPIPVLRAKNNWNWATHLVVLATDDIVYKDGFLSCGNLALRRAKMIARFPHSGAVYRFSN